MSAVYERISSIVDQNESPAARALILLGEPDLYVRPTTFQVVWVQFEAVETSPTCPKRKKSENFSLEIV